MCHNGKPECVIAKEIQKRLDKGWTLGPCMPASGIVIMQETEIASANSLEIKVMPNPSATQFNLTTESKNRTGKIAMKVMDAQGKIIDTRNNLMPGQTLRIGGRYRPGPYFIQVGQGERRRTTTVIKISE